MATPLRIRALERARGELGVTEQPPNSNWGPRVSQYLASVGITFPAPWCLAFVHWCYHREGHELAGYGLVQSFVNWAERNGKIVTGPERPYRGDIICYDWDGDNWHDHVGIVERVLALRWVNRQFVGWVRTIEGNTSVGDDSNGGKVMRRWRWVKHAKFARIPG